MQRNLGTPNKSARAVALSKDLNGIDAKVRKDAAVKLADLGPAAVDYAPALAKRLFDGSEEVRLAAAEALGKLGGEEVVAPHAASLVARFRSSDPKVLQSNAEALSKMGPAGAVVLASQLSHTKATPEVKILAAEALGRMRSVAAPQIESLISCLQDSNARLRFACMNSIGYMGDSVGSHAEGLAVYLDDTDEAFRDVTARTFGRMGSAAAPYARQWAQELNNEDPEFRMQAARILVLMSGAGAAALADQLTHYEERVRVVAVDALGQMGDAAVPHLPELGARVFDGDVMVRVRATEALGRFGTKAAPYASAIASLLWDSDSGARRAAQKILQQLGAEAGMTQEQLINFATTAGVSRSEVAFGAPDMFPGETANSAAETDLAALPWRHASADLTWTSDFLSGASKTNWASTASRSRTGRERNRLEAQTASADTTARSQGGCEARSLAANAASCAKTQPTSKTQRNAEQAADGGTEFSGDSAMLGRSDPYTFETSRIPKRYGLSPIEKATIKPGRYDDCVHTMHCFQVAMGVRKPQANGA